MKPTKKIQIVCGTGGVGKTTLSACLAIRHSLSGLKSVVMTIDPAKRLADLLNSDEMVAEPKLFYESSNGGQAFAVTLNAEETFRDLVKKYSPNLVAQERITNNVLYQHLTTMMSGLPEFMAIEKILELWRSDLYDVIVIDTAPLQNAVDFFHAPQKMLDLLQSSVLKFLRRGATQKTKQVLTINMFAKILGQGLFQTVLDFIDAFQNLLQGFEERAEDIRSIFKSKFCEFIMITSPLVSTVDEVKNFQMNIKEMGYTLSTLIINRNLAHMLAPPDIRRRKSHKKQNLKDKFQDLTFIQPHQLQQLEMCFQNLMPSIHTCRKFTNSIYDLNQKLKIVDVPFQKMESKNLSYLVNLAKNHL